MDQESLEALDDLIEALQSVADDPHMGTERDDTKFSWREAYQFLRGTLHTSDSTDIYNSLKQIRRDRPQKIEDLAQAYKNRVAHGDPSDFRSSSLAYKLFTAPIHLPKKAGSWALNRFSSENAMQTAHYATLLTQTAALTAGATAINPLIGPPVAAWCITSDIGDKILDYQKASQLMHSIWPSLIRGKEQELLATCNRKRIAFGELQEVTQNFVQDYKSNRIRADDCEELIELNPNVREFLDSIHREGHQYRHLTMGEAGFLIYTDLPHRGQDVVRGMKYFYNLDKSIHDTESSKKDSFRLISPIEGDHVVGSLLRKVGHDLMEAARENRTIPIRLDGSTLHTISSDTPQFKLSPTDDEEAPFGYTKGTVSIPLSEIGGSVDVDKLMGEIRSQVSSRIQDGHLIPYPTLRDCDDTLERSTLDLSGIADTPVSIDQLVDISNKASIEDSCLTITYSISPGLPHNRRRLRDTTIREHCGINPTEYVGLYSGLRGYKTIEHWSFPQDTSRYLPGDTHEDMHDSWERSTLSLDDIKDHMMQKGREKLEEGFKALYQKTLEGYRAKAMDDPSNENLFNLGLYTMLTDREEGMRLMDEAIKGGYLDEEIPVTFMGKEMGGMTTKNSNPLHMIDYTLSRSK